MSDERRGSPRQTAYVPAQIETASGVQAIAITRDVAAGGLLVLSRLRLAPGMAVTLRVSFGGRDDRMIRGKVVREEPMAPGESTLWIAKLAISVDPTDPVLVELLESLEKR
jgi:hypothetical protein